MSSTSRRLALLFVASIPSLALPARADIEFVDQFRSLYSTQTGDGATLTQDGYVFSTRLFASGANVYDSVTMTGPGGVVSLVADPSAPAVYGYGSGLYATEAAMDADFPLNTTYDYLATNASGSDATSLAVDSTAYPQSIPYLDGTTYSRLQGMDAGASFQVDFSPFTTGSAADPSFIFFTIYDATLGSSVYDAGFLPPTSGGLTLAANTLKAGHQYTYELIFSNRDFVSTGGTTFASQLGFDYRAGGTFTTAVPEPASFALAAFGVASGLLYGRGRRTRREAR